MLSGRHTNHVEHGVDRQTPPILKLSSLTNNNWNIHISVYEYMSSQSIMNGVVRGCTKPIVSLRCSAGAAVSQYLTIPELSADIVCRLSTRCRCACHQPPATSASIYCCWRCHTDAACGVAARSRPTNETVQATPIRQLYVRQRTWRRNRKESRTLSPDMNSIGTVMSETRL